MDSRVGGEAVAGGEEAVEGRGDVVVGDYV